MLRTAHLSTFSLACAANLFLSLAGTAVQAQESDVSSPLPTLAGAPFSGVGTQQIIRRTLDGNVFSHTKITHYYRDKQGRTRVERQLEGLTGPSADSAVEHTMIVIDDNVSGEVYFEQPAAKLARVHKRGTTTGAVGSDEPSAVPPPFVVVFDGAFIGPNEQGWSAPTSLGEKSIDGINATGTQRTYTIAAGAMHNQKPVTLTVEQWFSPSLEMVLQKSIRASTGGETTFRVDQIVQAEPDPSLFTIPSDYKRVDAGATLAGCSSATVTATSNGTVTGTTIAGSTVADATAAPVAAK